tara:strand:- start:3337 stop:3621 length:285 start_codon:yes stop_codon:yes gene_type:complete
MSDWGKTALKGAARGGAYGAAGYGYNRLLFDGPELSRKEILKRYVLPTSALHTGTDLYFKAMNDYNNRNGGGRSRRRSRSRSRRSKRKIARRAR